MSDLSQCLVLVVDDTGANVDVLVEALGDDHEISVAMDGPSALEAVSETLPDLILLDVMMPEMDGYTVCERLKADPHTASIPIIFLTALTDERDERKGLQLGAVDYITKPFNPDLVKARVRNHLELKLHRDQLERLVTERTQQLTLTQEVTIEAMASLAEYRDPETGGHIRRTQRYVETLARHLQQHPKFTDYLTDKVLHLLYQSAPLHDIGKIGVPDAILLKPGKLSADEFEVMKRHTVFGRDALKASAARLGADSFLQLAIEIAATHQEKWDGTGYPEGLSGEAIPISGRLMAVADVYDALISRRVYKPPMPHRKAVEIIREGRGAQFDPDMTDAFLEIAEDFRQIALTFADFEEERINLQA